MVPDSYLSRKCLLTYLKEKYLLKADSQEGGHSSWHVCQDRTDMDTAEKTGDVLHTYREDKRAFQC